MKQTEPKRLYQSVAAQILALIRQGEFPPGERLPPERELAQQLGVSRPSLREALIALEIGGRVEIRMGSGVYIVAAPSAKPATSEAELGESPIEIMNARSVIEGAIAASVAPFAKPKALKALRAVYETMAREVESGQIPMSADRAFHNGIAQMSGNDVLVRTVGALYDERHSPLSSTLRGHFEGEETWAAALMEHREILEALEARDAVQAQAAMQRHMRNSAARLMTRRKG
jgi:GntR family transcriptional repressor for pyruvate dehydrogenase complex